jgi:hypothetical protein
MVARDDLVQRARVRVFLEDDEVLQQVEEALPLEHPAHQHLQLQRRLRRVALAVDGAPDLEPLLVRRQRAHARLQAIAHHQRRVVVQQRGNLGLVGLQLRVGAPDRRVLIRRVLQLDQASGSPLTKTTMSGRRLCCPSITVNWFTASQSFARTSPKSTSRT